jgi:hypothetical protein
MGTRPSSLVGPSHRRWSCLTDPASAAATCRPAHYPTFLRIEAPACCMRLLDCSLRDRGKRSHTNYSSVTLAIRDVQEYLIHLAALQRQVRDKLARPRRNLTVKDTALDLVRGRKIRAGTAIDLPSRACSLPVHVKHPDTAFRLPGKLRHWCRADGDRDTRLASVPKGSGLAIATGASQHARQDNPSEAHTYLVIN